MHTLWPATCFIDVRLPRFSNAMIHPVLIALIISWILSSTPCRATGIFKIFKPSRKGVGVANMLDQAGPWAAVGWVGRSGSTASLTAFWSPVKDENMLLLGRRWSQLILLILPLFVSYFLLDYAEIPLDFKALLVNIWKSVSTKKLCYHFTIVLMDKQLLKNRWSRLDSRACVLVRNHELDLLKMKISARHSVLISLNGYTPEYNNIERQRGKFLWGNANAMKCLSIENQSTDITFEVIKTIIMESIAK